MTPMAERIFKKPKSLPPGATIGVVAPASPFKREDLEQGLSILKARGYAIHLADGLFETQGYLAGDDCLRAEQLHTTFCDPRVDAILCARGGFGSLRLLSLLDYELIGAHPKPFIGFSDISALHQAFLIKAGLVTFHGPMVCTLARGDAVTQTSLWQAVGQNQPVQVSVRDQHHRMVMPGKAQGLFVGGNLATLCHLLGTRYAASYENCILFIEETGEAPYRIDRMLMQMKLAGCLDGVCGLVLGSFTNCGEEGDVERLVRQLFDARPIPVMAGVSAGHCDRNVTLPMGIQAYLDADRGELRFLENATLSNAPTC